MKRRLILFLKVSVPVVIGFLIAYVLILRPWHHRWGATDAEIQKTLPGDNLIVATSQITHGITVDAPAEKVWSWLMQIGQDRSGFYSYTPRENLFGCEMPKVEALKLEWKPRTQGETVWFCAPQRFNGQGYMVAAVVEPQKAFVMVSGPDWSTLQNGGRSSGGSWASSSNPSMRIIRACWHVCGEARRQLWLGALWASHSGIPLTL
jgi:hypothetical protein